MILLAHAALAHEPGPLTTPELVGIGILVLVMVLLGLSKDS
jgi:hypothetical protein